MPPRRRFEKKFGVPPFRPHWLHLNDVRAHIYGVCFFDAPHAGGAPPNGVELHPVLRINYLGRGTRRLADPCRPPALRLAEPGRDWEDEARIEEPLVSEP